MLAHFVFTQNPAHKRTEFKPPQKLLMAHYLLSEA